MQRWFIYGSGRLWIPKYRIILHVEDGQPIEQLNCMTVLSCTKKSEYFKRSKFCFLWWNSVCIKKTLRRVSYLNGQCTWYLVSLTVQWGVWAACDLKTFRHYGLLYILNMGSGLLFFMTVSFMVKFHSQAWWRTLNPWWFESFHLLGRFILLFEKNKQVCQENCKELLRGSRSRKSVHRSSTEVIQLPVLLWKNGKEW